MPDTTAETSRAQSAAPPTCAVVLVGWNNRGYLAPCLESLYRGGLRNTFEVVVVDNGSTDGTQQMLCRDFPDVAVIQNETNVGLGRASNQGIRATRAPFVLLLNNDTIVNGASLDSLIDFMSVTQDAGAVGGTLLNEDGSFQAGYNRFPTMVEELLVASRLGDLLWPGYPSKPGGTGPAVVDWITSACLLLRRAALADVGLLDESYFIYGDETDIQFRLKLAGWRVYQIPEATTLHFGGRSLDRWRRRRLVYRGKMLFFKKHYGAVKTTTLRTLLAALTAAKLAVWAVVWPLPRLHVRAAREMASNIEVLRLCWKLD